MSKPIKKEWMDERDRFSSVYLTGVDEFVALATGKAISQGCVTSPCPCKRCRNGKRMRFEHLRYHLIVNGIDPKYRVWTLHGEKISNFPVKKEVVEENTPELNEVLRQEKRSRSCASSSHISKEQLGKTDVSETPTKKARPSDFESINKKLDSLCKGSQQMLDMLVTLLQQQKDSKNSSNAQPQSKYNSSSVEVESNGFDGTGATDRTLKKLSGPVVNPLPQMIPNQDTKYLTVILLSRDGDPVAKGVVSSDRSGETCHFMRILSCERKVYVTEVIDGTAPILNGPQNGKTIMQDVSEGGVVIWLNDLLKYV